MRCDACDKCMQKELSLSLLFLLFIPFVFISGFMKLSYELAGGLALLLTVRLTSDYSASFTELHNALEEDLQFRIHSNVSNKFMTFKICLSIC